MPANGTERTMAQIAQRLLRVADDLTPELPGIRRAWRGLLKHYEPCERYASMLANLYLGRRLRDLASTASHTYRLDSEQQGRNLAKQEVPIECAAAAVSLFVKCCLPYLRDDGPEADADRRALVKWAAVYQFFLIAGYRQQIAAEKRSLEERVATTERRFQALSAELGDAYEIERRRLAQDLHDEIGHDLIVLKLYTQLIGLDLNKGAIQEVRRKLKESISLIDHALQSVRHLVFDLGPAVWNEQGFVQAVRAYTKQFSVRTGIKVSFNARRLDAPLPGRYETALYKVLQGSLANIAAHAEARHVKITLAHRRDSMLMRVDDDGKGFDVGRTMSSGTESYGLRAMRDRIELLGGSITFASHPAGKKGGCAGTSIEVVLPLQEKVNAA